MAQSPITNRDWIVIGLLIFKGNRDWGIIRTLKNMYLLNLCMAAAVLPRGNSHAICMNSGTLQNDSWFMASLWIGASQAGEPCYGAGAMCAHCKSKRNRLVSDSDSTLLVLKVTWLGMHGALVAHIAAVCAVQTTPTARQPRRDDDHDDKTARQRRRRCGRPSACLVDDRPRSARRTMDVMHERRGPSIQLEWLCTLFLGQGGEGQIRQRTPLPAELFTAASRVPLPLNLPPVAAPIRSDRGSSKFMHELHVAYLPMVSLQRLACFTAGMQVKTPPQWSSMDES